MFATKAAAQAWAAQAEADILRGQAQTYPDKTVAQALERAGIRSLADGQAVTFDLERDRNGRESAMNLALA